MGVGDWFQTFCRNIHIGTEKRSSIAYRTGRIVGQLNADLRNLDSNASYRFYVGSYGRSTAIPSVSDVDLLYELPASLYERFDKYQGNGQSALLTHVRSSIQNTYQTRHTYASMMLSAGEHPMWVAQQMGHSDWAMIRKTYGRWMPDTELDSGGKAVSTFWATDAGSIPEGGIEPKSANI